ncbi:MAG: TIGR03013 family PEP-CTERM/XrtA system glycosyltransferase [Planctomycetota bacterium]|nr:TIGR03013 family PEP-CTERM/XrtA system glycosyltransferase [Planctomycetota bacterium]
MLHVLRHYLPIRKTLLIASELVLLTTIVAVGMSFHLWFGVDEDTGRRIAMTSLSPIQALWRCVISSFMVAVLAQIAIAFNELYDFRVSSSPYERATRFLGSAGSAILLVLGAVFLMNVWGIERVLDFPGLPFSQRLVLLTFTLMLGFALLYVWRNVFHFILVRLRINERLLIVGTGQSAQRLAEELRAHAESGYEIVGMVEPWTSPEGSATDEGQPKERRRWRRGGDPLGAGTDQPPDGAPTLLLEADLKTANEDNVPRGQPVSEPIYDLARRLDIDDIVVALEDRRGALPTQDLLQCRLHGIVVEEAETLYERVSGKLAVEAMRPSYLIFNPGFVQHPMARAAKRAFDLVLAGLVLAATWPIMIAAAIAIRLDTPGPVLFRQQRTGRGSEPFTLLKFRSMRHDAEKHTGPVWATEDDPRITRIGRFIRRTRIDELPQLFNILAGSMSMVGPRPERPEFGEELADQIPYYPQRHIVKPGLTGWAQINYPYGNTLEDASQKLQYDLFYIKYQSLLFDGSILFNTIKTVLLRKGT